MRDISERKAHIEALSDRAFHDGLTGLANRTLFTEHVAQALASATRNGGSRAILVMDVDGLSGSMTRLGTIKATVCSNRSPTAWSPRPVRPTPIARLGGDEFAILPGDAADLPGSRGDGLETATHVLRPGLSSSSKSCMSRRASGSPCFPNTETARLSCCVALTSRCTTPKNRAADIAFADNAQEELATRQLEQLLELRESASHATN